MLFFALSPDDDDDDADMDWRLLWLLALGREPDTDYVPPYVASLIFFFINMATGVVQRALTRLLVPVSVRGHVLDFLCTMEACAYFFENNFVNSYIL
ncbi:hypothetical protein C0Q70_09111 [Pomacea canaliculata]|uniref:Uncharacterized protein n=1 Tax=Pomacea canaliculata TaxID=400727 RepID=A0A2T7P8W5_POMCA|nr:hypothetical protein C0Q70_09111 [Pomacea canaliculata]